MTVLEAVGRVRHDLGRVAEAVGGSRTACLAARAGLAARSAFYLVLAALVAMVAVEGGRSGHQANAHGALTVIASKPLGLAAIAAAAAGFLVLGVVRVAGGLRDSRSPTWARCTTGLQGLFYVGLATVPLSFVLGRRQTGSEQQQHAQTAAVFAWPLGRELVAAAGVVVLVVCAWQIRTALHRDFTEGMRLGRRPRWVRRAVTVSGTVGIAARALVFAPIGVFLVVAAVTTDPRHADGLDAELATLARAPWGAAVLALVVLGLVVFAVYSTFEAAFRDVGRGR